MAHILTLIKAYLSARHLLSRDYPGSRLDAVRAAYSIETNMWPYLRQRRAEEESIRALFKSSFLAQLFGDDCRVSVKVLRNLDSPRQAAVAFRSVSSGV